MGVTVREKEKGSGEWWIFIRQDNIRRSKRVGGKRAAQDAAKQIEALITLGKFDLKPKSKPTFSEYADKWINTVVPATCKRSSEKDYRIILNKHLLPAFGDKNIAKIGRLEVKEFLLSKLNDGLSQSTVKHIKVSMSNVFNLALDDNVIQANPTANMGKIIGQKKQGKPKKVEVLTRQELNLLLDTVKEHYPEFYTFTLTLARTGLRIGEAIALQWNDIDWNSRQIHLKRSFSNSRFLTSTKSGHTRVIPMSLGLTDVLWHHQHEQRRRFNDNMPEWVFCNGNGEMRHPDDYRKRIFYDSLKKAGLRRITPHTLRHTVASLLLNSGKSMMFVKQLLGHSTIRITVDLYGHFLPDENTGVIDTLDGPGERHPAAPYRHPTPIQSKKIDSGKTPKSL